MVLIVADETVLQQTEQPTATVRPP